MGVKDSFIGRLLSNTGTFGQEQVAQTITLLLEHGLRRGASDIHIEPHGQLVWVRYRIHGSLHGLHKLPGGALQPLLTALRKKAELPTDIVMPQEGSFTETVDDKEVTVRLSTMRVLGGERAVLHFSEAAPRAGDLASLGFWGANLDLINTTLAQVHGLILVSGPKRSTRPATLYALIHLLRTAAISIGTIEEAIERRIPGITQTRVTPHNAASYEGAFHATLAQDMNAIMICDLPSKGLASEAVYAATTGHLIAAGLHGDSAAQGILHLRHMGVESYMLAAALRLSIASRSVRRLCKGCREHVALGGEQLSRLEHLFGMTTAANRKRVHALEQQAQKAGIGAELPLSSNTTHLTHIWQASRNGCEDCHHTGYDGLVTLVEVMPGGEYLYKVLNDTASTTTLQAAALKEGFVPLALDGMIKALRGETTLTEVVHEAGLH